MQTLEKYLPKNAVEPIYEVLKATEVRLKIVNERVTRHGDYRKLPNGQHQITVNANLNPYKFLITLVHELAHLVAFKHYGFRIKPHGKEWKHVFSAMMQPFIRPEIFPQELLPLLVRHFKSPRATTDTDEYLTYALKQYDPENDLHLIFEVPFGAYFKIHNGRVFQKGRKKVKRYECKEVETGRTYLFNPNAEVKILNIKHE